MNRFTAGRSRPVPAIMFAGILLAWPASSAQALTNAEIANLKGADRTALLLEGAKKEGKTVLYTSMNVDPALRPLAAAFDKKYPGVKFEFVRANSNEAMQKVGAEVRAKNQIADMMEGGSGAMATIKAGFAEAFFSPSLAAYDKGSLSPEGLWAPTRTNYYGLAYNTKLVPAAEVPQTVEDLLNPKWKDKIAWTTAADNGALLFIATMVKAKGQAGAEDYFKKLASQKIIDDPAGATGTTTKITQGEYVLNINASAVTPVQLARKGAPIDVSMLEPIPTQINTITLLKGAPHPYAANLFLDWLLSLEGQTLLSTTGYQAAHPDVPPDDDTKKILPKFIKKTAYFQTPEDVDRGKPLAAELLKKYFD
jgi:ABC-type Fe3+ transport system substrate-binding protein